MYRLSMARLSKPSDRELWYLRNKTPYSTSVRFNRHERLNRFATDARATSLAAETKVKWLCAVRSNLLYMPSMNPRDSFGSAASMMNSWMNISTDKVQSFSSSRSGDHKVAGSALQETWADP